MIAVDEEGHGRTAATDRALTAENSAGDVLAVLDQLHLDSVDVLGFSADQDVMSPEQAVRMSRAIPGARLLVVPGGHGDYLGELAASDGDLQAMHATLPFLQRFLDR